MKFAGTQNRKSLGFAEGSLIFDNSDGKLPVEFSEVVVTRKLYRSGETERSPSVSYLPGVHPSPCDQYTKP